MKYVAAISSLLLLTGAIGSAALAQSKGRASKSRPASSGDPDIAAMQRELAEQRQLLNWLIQLELQRQKLTGKFLPMLSKDADANAAGSEATSNADSSAESVETPRPLTAQTPPPPKRHAKSSNVSTATIAGTVTGAPDSGEIFVFVENIKGALAKDSTFEIRQENKQFVPRFAVVQRGTQLLFPNYDAIFHNAFSLTPGNTFDLGTYRAGDTPRSVSVTTPGVVEIFCNMHSSMSASVLVVPNSLFTRAKRDGSFTLANVPTGTRTIAVWAPGTGISRQQIELTSSGAQVNLALAAETRAGHTNKFGQPYGSYED